MLPREVLVPSKGSHALLGFLWPYKQTCALCMGRSSRNPSVTVGWQPSQGSMRPPPCHGQEWAP